MSDDRLRLIFTCCHPALPFEARIALTLRTLTGLTTAEIARAFRGLRCGDRGRRLDAHPLQLLARTPLCGGGMLCPLLLLGDLRFGLCGDPRDCLGHLGAHGVDLGQRSLRGLVSLRPLLGLRLSPAALIARVPEPVLPARSRIPAITGAQCSVLIVVASGDNPLPSTCLPAILVWPSEAPCLACP